MCSISVFLSEFWSHVTFSIVNWADATGEGKAESVSFLPSVDTPQASGPCLRVPDIMDEVGLSDDEFPLFSLELLQWTLIIVVVYIYIYIWISLCRHGK